MTTDNHDPRFATATPGACGSYSPSGFPNHVGKSGPQYPADAPCGRCGKTWADHQAPQVSAPPAPAPDLDAIEERARATLTLVADADAHGDRDLDRGLGVLARDVLDCTAELRRLRAERDNYLAQLETVDRVLGAIDDEPTLDAAERVTRERDSLRACREAPAPSVPLNPTCSTNHGDDPCGAPDCVVAPSVPAEGEAPIPMRLPCPRCGELHVDEGEFATKPHHTHACQHCGEVWRPAVVATVGVRFLPGFKNPDPPPGEPAPDALAGVKEFLQVFNTNAFREVFNVGMYHAQGKKFGGRDAWDVWQKIMRDAHAAAKKLDAALAAIDGEVSRG